MSQVESFRHDLMWQLIGTQEILHNIKPLYEIKEKKHRHTQVLNSTYTMYVVFELYINLKVEPEHDH